MPVNSRVNAALAWEQMMQSEHILALFQIERSLVFEPTSVILHAGNLLAVVVRYGVLRARCRRVRTVAFDPCKERLFFLRNVSTQSPGPNEDRTYLGNQFIPASPTRPERKSRRAKGRSAQPSTRRDRKGRYPQYDDGIEAGDLCAPRIDVLLRENGRYEADGGGGRDHGGSEVDPSPPSSEVEESVPGQDIVGHGRLRRAGGGRRCVACLDGGAGDLVRWTACGSGRLRLACALTDRVELACCC